MILALTLENRRLYESCERSEQCTAYGGASECKDIDGVKICHCREDSRVFNGVCLKCMKEVRT